MHALTNVKVTRDDARWEAEVRAEIPTEILARYRAEALKEIQKTAKLDGFRPGKAPESRIIEVYGEDAILRKAAENAVQKELPELLAVENLPIVDTPKVTIDTLHSGAPLSFTARAALAPNIELADYKKIAAKHPPVGDAETAVSDDEHVQALTHLRRERVRIEKIESGVEPNKAHEESRATADKDIPPLDDAFVQALGYENIEAFSNKLRENIKTEKGLQAQEKRRAAILDDLVKESTISYPVLLREYELNDMEARMTDDLARGGATFEQHLTQIKKTREEIRAGWREAADKRAKVRLILGEIARKESVEANPERLAHELEHAKKHYSQADPAALRAHIAHALRNDAVLKLLENI